MLLQDPLKGGLRALKPCFSQSQMGSYVIVDKRHSVLSQLVLIMYLKVNPYLIDLPSVINVGFCLDSCI